VDVEVVIEIPAGTGNKYDVDRDTGALRLDRHPVSAAGCPGRNDERAVRSALQVALAVLTGTAEDEMPGKPVDVAELRAG
jgi:inorganic pyrophosphatase